MYFSEKPWCFDTYKCQSIRSEYPCTLSKSFCNDITPRRWCHNGCGGYLRLYENGKEKCTKCGAEDYFCNWLYTNAPKNQKIDYHKQNAALTYLVGLDDNDVDPCFWLNLKASLNYQKKTFPNRFI